MQKGRLKHAGTVIFGTSERGRGERGLDPAHFMPPFGLFFRGVGLQKWRHAKLPMTFVHRSPPLTVYCSRGAEELS